MLELLAPGLATCVLLAAILGYFGLHVLLREVIFVDLALAQLAALGAASGHAIAPEAGPTVQYVFSLAFTLLGAGIFAGLRTERWGVPQEALIGIVYGVSAALVLLILSKSAIDRDEVESMLTGRLLFVEWPEVAVAAVVCAVVAAVHLALHRQFMQISRRALVHRPLDFVFYATFGVVVTSSVQMAGVLVVFSLLIAPAACAALLFASLPARMLGALGVGALASGAGIYASALWDLPTGPAVVAALGLAFALTLVGRTTRGAGQSSD